MAFSLSRRTFFAGSAAGVAASGLGLAAVPARADDHAAHGGFFQGVQRRKVGSATVYALSDGALALDASVFPAVDDAAFASAHAAEFLPAGPVATAVNAYLIEIGDERILIDSGTADLFGPTLGKLEAALSAAGLETDSISKVFLTHLHPDHAGGMLREGKPRFANAEVRFHAAEDFWLSEDNKAAAPDSAKPFFDNAMAVAAAYGDNVARIDGDSAVIAPGLTAMAMTGHTPGHMGLMLESEGAQLLIWGDIIHNQTLQFADPSITIAFDTTPEEAAQTRARVLDQVVVDRLMVAGMHLDFPGFGHIDQLSGGGYHFLPARFPYAD